MKYIKSLNTIVLQQKKSELLCIHHAGGGASFFYSWAKFFKDRRVSALQLPGREELIQENLLYNIGDVIDTIWDAFVQFAQGPYILFGHSVGALISFELLKRAILESVILPKQLIVSACRAPHVPLMREPFHNLCDDDFIEKLKTYGGTPSIMFDQHKELIDIFIPILKADFSLSENYKNSEVLSFPFDIWAFIGKADPMVPIDSVMEWSRYTQRAFNLVQFEGGHFYMKDDNNHVLEYMAKILN